MKQNDVFSKRETLRPVNTLTCFDSASTSSLYVIKMKELITIYKEEGLLLQDGLDKINSTIQEQNNIIINEIEPDIQRIQQMLQLQIQEYESEMQQQITQIESVRNDNLNLEKELILVDKRLTSLDDHIGQQILQRKYDIKFQ